MVKLKLMPKEFYPAVDKADPLRFYFVPFFGGLYRSRVEVCLTECLGGERILDIGFGSGVNFLNLDDMYNDIYGLDLTVNVEEVYKTYEEIGILTKLVNGNVLDLPYEDDFFDTVLLISILEHVKPHDLQQAMKEIKRVLKPGGQMVYGVPVESTFMVFMFRILGINIRDHHFSTEEDVFDCAKENMEEVNLITIKNPLPFLEPVYQTGHFKKI